MIIRRLDRRKTKQSLADALLTLASTLTSATTPDSARDELGRGLAAHDLPYALLCVSGAALRIDRATLPFATNAWGTDLPLSKLANAASLGRPVTLKTSEAFFVAGESLLTKAVPDTLVAAPAGRESLLCVALAQAGDAERNAVWTLAMQLGAALEREEGAPPSAAAQADLSLFHDLTRRLSYTLSDDDVLRAGVEAIASAVDIERAVSVLCRGGADAVTVYGVPGDHQAAAAAAIQTFRQLTGDKHASCEVLPIELALAAISTGDPTDSPETLDAPLVVEGEVTGLLRLVARDASAHQAIFYTVANQLSLAVERGAVQRRAGRAQLASLAESLADGIVLVDSSLRVTSINEVARKLLPALDEGSTLAESPLAPIARSALSSGEQTEASELPVPADGAARRYLVAMGAPLAGSPEGSAAVLIVRDVTEERLMQERLLQSEKMVSVGQLVSGVAHELNNPLTGIMGFAQLLQARELDQNTLEGLETIYSEAERASKIVQNLLSFARRKRADK
jgi:PAS domain-containing protein